MLQGWLNALWRGTHQCQHNKRPLPVGLGDTYHTHHFQGSRSFSQEHAVANIHVYLKHLPSAKSESAKPIATYVMLLVTLIAGIEQRISEHPDPFA